METKKSTPRRIKIKMAIIKDKERILRKYIVYVYIYTHTYMYNWVTFLYSRIRQNIVNQIHFFLKKKERILNPAREKQVIYKENPVRLSQISAEILKARREWHGTFKVIEAKNLQARILYQARLSFRFDDEIKNFTEKQN